MKSQQGQNSNKGFTIIELLTVMSIIVILIGLLVPALNQVRRFALKVKQNAQFHAIENALELYRTEFEQYPESKAVDSSGNDYPGAMRLCEALMGQDLMGFHSNSRFLSTSTTGPDRLYRLPQTPPQPFLNNLKQRQGPYLEPENVGAYQLQDFIKSFSNTSLGTVADMFVINDVYKRAEKITPGGDNKVGMPVLYFNADVSGTVHDPNVLGASPASGGNIYNYWDNEQILALNLPWNQSLPHRMTKELFYEKTENEQIRLATGVKRPYRPDGFILMSAGWDGEFGTRDDVTNFDRN